MKSLAIGCLALVLLSGCQNAPSKEVTGAPANLLPEKPVMPPTADRALVRCSGEDGAVIISPAMIPVLTAHKDDALAMLEACGKGKRP